MLVALGDIKQVQKNPCLRIISRQMNRVDQYEEFRLEFTIDR